MAKMAYSGPVAPTRTAQGTEYDLFARITHKLRQALSQQPARHAELVAALHENRRLWTVLAADVSDDANALPKELRARLFYLAEFTRIHTGKILGGTATTDVLVEINTAVMRGLRAQGEVK
jgi:flagellar protein FlaF